MVEEIHVREETILQNEECANCGKPQAIWSNRYESAGETYCCEGCAENAGCTCEAQKPEAGTITVDEVDELAKEGSTRTQNYNPEKDPRPYARRES